MIQDDDIHVIATMKGFILPLFHCMKTHHRPNRTQIIMPTPTTDQIDCRHCMSFPIASQNTQYYLKAGCGQACAVVSLKMA
jgi:hypothetical protein